MTTPTPAQIEALRWIAAQRDNEDADLDTICTRAERALTAAAEVGETERLLTECVRERENYNGAHQASCLEIERLRAALQLINDYYQTGGDLMSHVSHIAQDALTKREKEAKPTVDDYCATCGWCGKYITLEWQCDCDPDAKKGDQNALRSEMG